MPLLTKFGTQYGNRLLRTGRQFFVAPSTSTGAAQAYTGIAGNTVSASNNNDGLSPERPVATVDYAVNTLATQVGDMVILLPGTHTVLNQVVPKTGVAIFGSEMAETAVAVNGAEVSGPTVLTSVGTNIHLLNIKANNVEVGYLTLRPTAAFSAVIFAPETGGAAGPASFATTSSTAITGIYLHDLVIDLKTVTTLGTGNINTRGIDFGCRFNTGTGQLGRLGARWQATVFAEIDRVTFYGSGGQGEGIHLATCQVQMQNPVFRMESNTAAGLLAQWASPFVVASTVANSLVDHAIFIATGNGPSYGSCIDGGSATASNLDAITFSDARFPRAGQLTYTAPYSPTSGGSSGPTGSLGSPAHGFPTTGISFINSFLANQATMYVYYTGGA